jgi:hypothetical protein
VTWFKVDDKLHSHPKAARAGRAGIGVWVLTGSWSADYLTDGYVPPETLRAVGGSRSDADRLVTAGLWLPLGDGWQFRDWCDYQPLRADVLKRRAKGAERLRQWRADRDDP